MAKGKRSTGRVVPVTNEIVMYFHCGLCLAEIPDGQSPRDWGQIEAGWTPLGLQVWCKRHEVNILHVDFEGQQHPAATHRTKEFKQ